MTRIEKGLAFKVISPSFWSMLNLPIDISFLGDAWYVHCGEAPPSFHKFASREEAIALIAKVIRGIK